MRLVGSLLSLAMLLGCAGSDPSIEIDTFFTLDSFLGRNPVVHSVIHRCEKPTRARAFADGEMVAEVDPVVVVTLTNVAGESRNTFSLEIDAALVPPETYGIPARFDVHVDLKCEGGVAVSAAVPMKHLLTQSSVIPGFNPTRFWAAAQEPDILSCDNRSIVRWRDGVDRGGSVDVGFPCAIGEMSGNPGERRYLSSEDLGLAALDPGPTVVWTRELPYTDGRFNDTDDPIILYEELGIDYLAVLDRDTGLDLFPPVALARPSRGQPVRLPNGDLLVLEAERPMDFSFLAYWVHRFSPTGVDLGETQVVRYNWNSESYLAEFDPTGEHIYVTAAPVSEEDRWVEKVDTTTGAVVWGTTRLDPYRIGLGEASGRLLVTTDNGFAWLDPADGTPLTSEFGPESGTAFLRGAVELDGSIQMIADPVGSVAFGLYIFDPAGGDTVRLPDLNGIFRWLTPAWDGGAIVSYQDELHVLYSRERYAMLQQGL